MAPTVADVVVDGLLRSGVARIFAAGRPAERGLYAAAVRRGLTVVDAGASATASLLAAVTGEVGEAPGVALVAEATGTAQGLAHAVSSRAPTLVVSTTPSPSPSFKGEVMLTPESAAHGTAHAIQLALGPPRGPVHVTLALDIADRPSVPVATTVRPAPLPPPDARALDEAARRLGEATRPVLVVGLECRTGDVAKWLRPLAETLPAPVLTTPRARGVLPDPHPLNLGSIGEGKALLAQADLVAMVGVDALEVVPSAWPASTPILHIGTTPSARADRVPSLEVVGDIALVIEELAPRLRGRTRADWDVAAVDRLKRQLVTSRRVGGPARVVASARDMMVAGTVAAADPGLCEAAVAAGWQAVGPSELLIPGEGGAPGFALTAALASRLERPDRWALAFTDRHGLAPDGNALGVMARLKAPVVVIVLGPAQGGAAPAERMGLTVAPAPTESALARALSAALAGGAPCLIDTSGGREWSPSV
jgi:acetolactate synthase-1/2/3 large subunit